MCRASAWALRSERKKEKEMIISYLTGNSGVGFNNLFTGEEECMGLFERLFTREPAARPVKQQERVKPDIKRLFEGLSRWSTGKRFIDADPKYSEVIRSLPPGTASSMRLSRVAGTISVTGEQPKVFGYPGSLDYNMPALTSLSGMARVLVDLGYSGVEREAGPIRNAVLNRQFKFRITSFAEREYPLVRLQIGFYGGLQEPLFLEVLSDLLDRNVQDFYTTLLESGRYEIALHVQREYLASAFCTIADSELLSVAGGLKMAIEHLQQIPAASRSMPQAVQAFERRHRLGEGMA